MNENIKGRMKRKRNKTGNKKTVIIIACIIIISLGNIFFGYDKVKEDKNVTIEQGSSVFKIADTLKSEKVISKKMKFIAEVILSGKKSDLKFGDFEFKKGMNYKNIVNVLVTEGAKRETVTLTIPEGYSVENIIEVMKKAGLGDDESIKKALNSEYDYEFISKIPKKEGQKYRLQGFLFPSTYEFYKDAKPEDVIDTMLKEFEKEYLSVCNNFDDVYEVITKASMVEKEAKIESERATIAGVFENRLKKGKRLEICATVLYVVTNGIYDKNKVYYNDLEINSPYNTYRNDGLPVGPITNPGIESIKASLNPERHEYLFYHTDEKKNDGSHIFTKNFENHKATK